MKANQPLVELVTRIADQHRATPAQIALTWLFAQKSWIVPIPGTRKLTRLEENLASTDVELTGADLTEIEETISRMDIRGARGTGQERYV
jgi:aryl-alcohol dehydrogenase-like predicted oxidoreductase